MAGDLKIALLTQMQLMIAEEYCPVVKMEHLAILSHRQQQTESKVKKTMEIIYSLFSAFWVFLILFGGSLFFTGHGSSDISDSAAVC